MSRSFGNGYEPLIVDLEALNDEQWEALCDGCGRCCLCKFEDADSGEMLYTDIICSQFDLQRCRCRHYSHRQQVEPECLDIRSFSSDQFRWLPQSCAYRLSHEGKSLPAWHPWVVEATGSPNPPDFSVRDSVAGNSEGMSEEQLISHIVCS